MKTSIVTQVATFEKLLGFCNAQGAMYNPPTDSLKVTALSSLLTSAQKSVQAVNDLTAVYRKTVGERSQAFDQLPKFMTQLVNALKAANAPVTTINEASRYKKRFATRVKSRRPTSTVAEAANGDPPAAQTTRAQGSFDHQFDAFDTMIKFVSTEPLYITTDQALSAAAMSAFRDNLREKNKAVVDAFAALSFARKQRDKILFSKGGIHHTGSAVKHYFRSILGTQNATTKEVAAMRFFIKKAATK